MARFDRLMPKNALPIYIGFFLIFGTSLTYTVARVVDDLQATLYHTELGRRAGNVTLAVQGRVDHTLELIEAFANTSISALEDSQKHLTQNIERVFSTHSEVLEIGIPLVDPAGGPGTQPYLYFSNGPSNLLRNLIPKIFDVAQKQLADARAENVIIDAALLGGAEYEGKLLYLGARAPDSHDGAPVERPRPTLILIDLVPMMKSSMRAINMGGLDVHTYHPNGQLIYFHKRRQDQWVETPDAGELSRAVKEVHSEHKVAIGGSEWRLIFVPAPKFKQLRNSRLTTTVYIVGATLTLILILIILRQKHYQAALMEARDEALAARDEMEDRVAARTREAKEANRAKSDFLASMSHELRTPLNSIIGFSEMMSNRVFGKLGDDRYEEYLKDIQKSGYLLLHLVNDVLDLSKIEAGKFELEESDVELDEPLRSSLQMIRGRKEANSISIRYEPASRPLRVRADERAIKQIALNLLTNAVKYNVEGGEVVLTVGREKDGSIAFSVSDTGIGVAAEDIPKILEPFGQVRRDAHKTHEGTGLGLALSNQLVDLHGGTLEIESEPGKGTTVTVKFPAERAIL